MDIKKLSSQKLSGQEVRVVIACMALGVDNSFVKVSIRNNLVQQTGLSEKNISRVIRSMKDKNIVQTKYVRETRDFYIKFNIIEEWEISTKPKRLG